MRENRSTHSASCDRRNATLLLHAAAFASMLGCGASAPPPVSVAPAPQAEAAAAPAPQAEPEPPPPTAANSAASADNDAPQAAPPAQPAASTPAAPAAPATSSLHAYRDAIAQALSPAARARLEAQADVGPKSASDEACYARMFSTILTDAVARHVAVPAFRRVGGPYLRYVQLVARARPLQAHTDVEWQNFTFASPATMRCEGEETPSDFCQRARRADRVGTAVASTFDASGNAGGSVPTDMGGTDSWSISLASVIETAEALGVSRRSMEAALIQSHARMRAKTKTPCTSGESD